MAQSGSDASLNVIPITDRSRMRPRQEAPAEVATVFMELVSSMPADHFRRTDAPLIEAYAQAIVLGREAYEHLQSGASYCRQNFSLGDVLGEGAPIGGGLVHAVAAGSTVTAQGRGGRPISVPTGCILNTAD